MRDANGKAEWRFDAECLVWEIAHSLPAAISEPDFWQYMTEAIAGKAEPGEPLLPALRGDFAAIAFLDWARGNDRCGTLSSAELSTCYQLYCAESPHVSTGENRMRKFLAVLPGVQKIRSDCHDEGGRRTRFFYWVIEPRGSP